MADMFTNALRLFIDNNEDCYNHVMSRARILIESGDIFPAELLADCIEDEIFNICWKVDASAYSLESDMREIVRNKIDFDWLASVYLDDVQDALLTT